MAASRPGKLDVRDDQQTLPVSDALGAGQVAQVLGELGIADGHLDAARPGELVEVREQVTRCCVRRKRAQPLVISHTLV